MLKSIEELNEKFERIKNLGLIKERRHGFGAIGYTFECMLNKEEENFPVPDYNEIEIKTMNKNAKTKLHLFNLTPDGDYLFPIKRILEKIGCPKGDSKVFYREFNAISDTKMIYGMRGKLFVNRKEGKVELLVFDHHDKNIDIGVSWSFDWLEERLDLKLKYLALVRASSYIISGEGYYHYNKINYYQLKDFETFLTLLEKGIITINFKISVYKSGRREGQIHDRGTDFSIDVNDLNLLYDEIKID